MCGEAWGMRSDSHRFQLKETPSEVWLVQAASPSKALWSLNDASLVHINHCQTTTQPYINVPAEMQIGFGFKSVKVSA